MSELVLERNDEIPKDWKLIPLGEISNVVRGASPRPAGSPIFFGGSIPWITVKFLTADENPYLFSTNETVTKAGKSKSRYVQPDTLLITNSGATLGVPKIIKIGGCINDGIVAIEEVSYPLKKYLYYYLLSLTKKLRMINQGAAQPNLNTSIIKSILIPLPPLNEQKRIVEKIEELFSKLDNTKRILENTIDKLKTKKQSFLNFALVGKLTEDWCKKNNIKQHIDKDPLENLLIFSKNGFTGRPNNQGVGYARLGIETITSSNSIYVNISKCKFIEIPSTKLDSYTAKEGDLFVCRQNGNKNYVGKCAIFKNTIKPTIFSDSLIQLRVNQEFILPEYLAYYLISMFGRRQIEQFCSTTAGNYSINGTNLKKTVVSYPSIPEQKIVISKIEEGYSLIENSEKLLSLSIKDIEIMKSALLKNTFEGKLVPQDPNDEPSIMLLEKIKKEKEQLIQQNPKRRKKNVK